MICTICNITIPDQAKFCPVCGTAAAPAALNEAVKTCPSCGTENPVTAKFCRKDGTPLPSAPEQPATAAAPVTPPVVTEKPVLQSGPLPAEQATVKPAAVLPEPAPAPPVRSAAPLPAAGAQGKKPVKMIAAAASILVVSCGIAYWYFTGAVKKEPDTPEPPAARTSPTTAPTKAQDAGERKPAREARQEEPRREPRREEPAFDPAKLEGEINRALRNDGIDGITAQVNEGGFVTLKGVAASESEKSRAFRVAKSLKGVQKTRDMVFVVGK